MAMLEQPLFRDLETPSLAADHGSVEAIIHRVYWIGRKVLKTLVRGEDGGLIWAFIPSALPRM